MILKSMNRIDDNIKIFLILILKYYDPCPTIIVPLGSLNLYVNETIIIGTQVELIY